MLIATVKACVIGLNHQSLRGHVEAECPVFLYPLVGVMSLVQQETSSDKRLHLLSKELEDATNQFLLKIEELEKLLPLIDE